MNTQEKALAIAQRAVNAGITLTTILTLLIDLDKAVEHLDLDLDRLLNAEPFDFAHDIVGIQSDINRSTEQFSGSYTSLQRLRIKTGANFRTACRTMSSRSYSAMT